MTRWPVGVTVTWSPGWMRMVEFGSSITAGPVKLIAGGKGRPPENPCPDRFARIGEDHVAHLFGDGSFRLPGFGEPCFGTRVGALRPSERGAY